MTTTATPTTNIDAMSQLAKNAGDLYSLPAVAMEVLDLTRQDQVDSQAIKECIEKDPALVVKIMRVVNSSLFGLSGQVSDLNHALALIGAKPLKLLVLGFSLPEELFDELDGDVLNQYWRHTVVKAVAAREISEAFYHLPGDEAFIGGLLEDIGMLVLLQQLGEPYAKLVLRAAADGANVLSLEATSLGFTHIELGARLLDRWGLPDALVRAVALPHEVQRLSQPDVVGEPLAQILHLAELVALLLTQKRANALNELLHAGGTYRDLTIEDIYSLLELLEGKVAPLAEALSIPWPEGENYFRVVEDAYQQLAKEATDAAARLALLDDADIPFDFDSSELQGAVQGIMDRPAMAAGGEGDLGIDDTIVAAVETQKMETAISQKSGLAQQMEELEEEAAAAKMHSQFTKDLAAAIYNCRQNRQPISLAVMEIDDFEELLTHKGPDTAGRVIQLLEIAIGALADGDGDCIRVEASRFAIILEDFDRRMGVDFVRRLVSGIRDWSAANHETTGGPITVSAGVATLAIPPKNFPTEELFEAADQCSKGAVLSGGDAVKSIDIC